MSDRSIDSLRKEADDRLDRRWRSWMFRKLIEYLERAPLPLPRPSLRYRLLCRIGIHEWTYKHNVGPNVDRWSRACLRCGRRG